MYKIFFALSLMITSLFSSVEDIDSKIINNKQEYLKVSKKKTNIDKNLKTLASKIKQEKKSYDKIVKVVDKTNSKLALNKLKLTKSIRKLKALQKQSVKLSKQKKQIEKDVIDFVIERYAMSMGIQQINKESLKDVINKEVYTLVLQNAKQEVLNFNIAYLKVNRSTRINQDKIKKLNLFIDNQKKIKKKYDKLKDEQVKIIDSLSGKHEVYQSHLKDVISKQNGVMDILSSLNILKTKEIQKEKSRIRKAQENFRKREAKRKAKLKKANQKKKAKITKTVKSKNEKTMKFVSKKNVDNIKLEVRNIGSSTKGIKILKYRGRKTIAPLKSYTITKKFGKYYDEVYNLELFNESVSLKTKKPNAKVFSVFKGQIVYAKQNSGLLQNVVIVKHRNNLHTIYSHLDKISPTLKVGKWIPKGYVVGRLNGTLQFQATKDSKYINPLKLFK